MPKGLEWLLPKIVAKVSPLLPDRLATYQSIKGEVAISYQRPHIRHPLRRAKGTLVLF